MKDFLDSLDLDKNLKFGIFVTSVSEHINRCLYGEMMTLVDVSSKDLESRRATKSLISQAFTRHTRQLLSSLNDLENMEVKDNE